MRDCYFKQFAHFCIFFCYYLTYEGIVTYRRLEDFLLFFLCYYLTYEGLLRLTEHRLSLDGGGYYLTYEGLLREIATEGEYVLLLLSYL